MEEKSELKEGHVWKDPECGVWRQLSIVGGMRRVVAPRGA